MPLTRYERGVIEDLMNKVVKQQDAINLLQDEVARLSLAIEAIGGDRVLSPEELTDVIEDAVRKILKRLPVKNHTHLSDKEGGPAFAKKGATLISQNTAENE